VRFLDNHSGKFGGVGGSPKRRAVDEVLSGQDQSAELSSHAESNQAARCAARGPSGSLQDRRTFLANRRNKHLSVVAGDSVAGAFDVTESARLPRLWAVSFCPILPPLRASQPVHPSSSF
jgi:hypothetical protein